MEWRRLLPLSDRCSVGGAMGRWVGVTEVSGTMGGSGGARGVRLARVVGAVVLHVWIPLCGPVLSRVEVIVVVTVVRMRGL